MSSRERGKFQTVIRIFLMWRKRTMAHSQASTLLKVSITCTQRETHMCVCMCVRARNYMCLLRRREGAYFSFAVDNVVQPKFRCVQV